MATDLRSYLERVGGTEPMRILHMVVSSLAAIGGIFFLVTGVTSLTENHQVFSGKTLPILCIILGVFVTFISLLGVAGSVKRSQYIFGTYSGIMTLLILAQIIGFLVLWLRPFDAEEHFSDVWERLYKDDPNTIRQVEKDLRCCGFQSPVDMPVPAHCSTKKKYGFTRGCLKQLEHQWGSSKHMILYIGFVMVAAQIVMLLMGTELARRFKNSRQGYTRVPGRAEGSPLLRGSA